MKCKYIVDYANRYSERYGKPTVSCDTYTRMSEIPFLPPVGFDSFVWRGYSEQKDIDFDLNDCDLEVEIVYWNDNKQILEIYLKMIQGPEDTEEIKNKTVIALNAAGFFMSGDEDDND